MGVSSIEWTDLTFSPWHGCEKVSPACAHCYAEGQSNRFNGPGMWGAGHGFRFQSDAYWSKPLQWARNWPAKLGRRPRVFCASMADVFEERDELEEHRLRLFTLIRATPELDWLVLTKRPEFARDWLRQLSWHSPTTEQHAAGVSGFQAYLGPEGNKPLPNVWMGVSIENARYTWRADVLREIPAAVRFISAEPLLGSLFNDPKPRVVHGPDLGLGETRLGLVGRQPLDLTGIDWVIAGGESGPKARPSHPDWFRELRDACLHEAECALNPYAAAFTEQDERERCDCGKTAFFFKQWGEWAPGAMPLSLNGRPIGPQVPHVAVPSGGGYSSVMAKLGKKAAGRVLDGRVWDEFPQGAAVPA